MTDIKAIKELVKYSVNKKVPTNFEEISSLEDVEGAIRKACEELASNIYEYQRNKTYIFEIIQTAIDETLPNKVLATIGQFAEVQQFDNQSIARFKIKKGRNRAKQFVTRAAVSGVYETFRLDQTYIDVTCNAYGAAAFIDFERYLNGEEDFAEYAGIVMEGLEEAVYKEIWNALKNAKAMLIYGKGEGANYAEIDGDEDTYSAADTAAILKLVTTAKRYSGTNGAMILGTEPLLQKFTNGGGEFVPNVPASDLDEIKDTGLIGKWRGNALVALPNSFEDETNTTTTFEDCYGFVFPVGRSEKVVKVALQGPTVVKDWDNRDNSMEIQAYKKFGVTILTYNDWCMFKVGSLAPQD